VVPLAALIMTLVASVAWDGIFRVFAAA